MTSFIHSMLSGVVLSGGRSTRMGREKGLVLLAGAPLAVRVARVLAKTAEEVSIAVAPGMSKEYERAVRGEFSVVEDERPALGPIEGLITALSHSKGEYVLVSPCDTPFLVTDVCIAIAENAKGRDGAVPRIMGKFEPLHGAYRRDVALEAFRDAAETGKRKPIDAYPMLDLAFLSEEVLSIIDPLLESFWNLNTPEDLKRAEKRLRAGTRARRS
jgi:molybdopterin-guanine dinucleotide biosynthesis protein A